MGARQSMDDRPRSNSVDTTASADRGGPASIAPRGASRSVLSAADFLNAMSRASRGEDSGSDDDSQPGPSRPPPYPRETNRRSHGSTSSSSSIHGRRVRIPHHLSRRSVPLFMVVDADINCPICHKRVASDEADVHLVMCLTRPKITYNEDVLTECKGECSICLDEMDVGATIARLPCLCVYHKGCIDDWFKRKNCCPEHPGDD